MAIAREAALACAFVAALWALPAGAVRPGEVSSTAESTCELRALAAQHPDAKLRNSDTVAERLCSWTSPLPRDYAAARPMIDQGETFSAFFYVNARTRYIDAALEEAATSGVTQVVVLGAGFDSRAYRFHESHPDLRFFEVDLPATIEAKKQRVVEVLGALPEYVRYAPIDFNAQKLEDVLLPLGYDPKQRGFFLLEGVVMYVAEAGNAATFDFLRRHAAPGSVVVYDYVLKRVIEGDTKGLYAAEYVSFAVEHMGEPFVCGWTPAEAAAWARRFGFVVVEDIDSQVLTRRYLIGSNGKPDGRVHDWLRLMQLRVP